MSKLCTIPYPKYGKYTSGSHCIARFANIYCASESIYLAETLTSVIKEYYPDYIGKIVDIGYDTFDDKLIMDGLLILTSPVLSPEGYTVDVNSNRITITGADYSGLYYGVYTLMQFFPTDKQCGLVVPCLHIDDSPQYPWRGLLLDVARNFIELDEIYRLIDLLSASKINKLHLHLSDDQGFRIESLIYPKLNSVGSVRADSQIGGFDSNRSSGVVHSGYYTQAEIKALVDYANKHAIDIVPGIEFPFHSAAMIAAYPEISCNGEAIAVPTTFGDIDKALCLGRADNVTFYFNLMSEILPLFTSQYYHLGGSNINYTHWAKCPRCQARIKELGLNSERDMLTYAYNDINNHCRTMNKKMILFNTAFSPALDRSIAVQYYSAKHADELIEDIHNRDMVIISTSNLYYFDYPYAISPLKPTYCEPLVPNELTRAKRGAIVGIEAALWTEWIYDREKRDFNLFPRIIAIAEKCWSGSTRVDYCDFIARCGVYKTTIHNNSINWCRRWHKSNCIFRRIRVAYQWYNSDQYTEVKHNRKLIEKENSIKNKSDKCGK